MIERQEIHCHECGKYVQFDIDTEMEGNHVLECPECGHEHCRVVKGGQITGERWDQRNGQTFVISTSTITTTISSNFTITSGSGFDITITDVGSNFLRSSWATSTTV